MAKRGDTVVSINRPEFDLNDIISVQSIDLSNIDILINNAGHELGMGKSFNDMTQSDIISQVNVNLLSPMLLTHQFINQNSKGTVINITSGCINDLKKSTATYFTTKSGLSCFTKAVSKDMKHSFRFVEIVPRRIKTNFHQTSKASDLYNNDYILDVNEVSKVILFIIDNPYITNITVKDPRR